MSEVTREMILAMPAGRELDALVAERVMGWRWIKIPDFSREKQLGVRWNRIRALCSPCGNPPADFQEKVVDLGHVLPFSTNIAAAWQVVEKITEPPRTIEEAERAANTKFGFWFNSYNLWACTAQEAALEICRAALLATLEDNTGGTIGKV